MSALGHNVSRTLQCWTTGVAIGAVMLTGCQRAETPEAAKKAQLQTAEDGVTTPLSGSPEPGYALRLLLANLDVPLTVDESCDGVGTATTDRTIGDFLAGFLAAQSEGSNKVATQCGPVDAGTSKCDVLLKHADDEDEWAWGVSFQVRHADGRMVRESVRCLGAG